MEVQGEDLYTFFSNVFHFTSQQCFFNLEEGRRSNTERNYFENRSKYSNIKLFIGGRECRVKKLSSRRLGTSIMEIFQDNVNKI